MKAGNGMAAMAAVGLYFLVVLTADAHLIYSFEGAQGNEETSLPDAQPASGIATPMRRGPGLIPDTATNAFNARSWTSGSSIDPDDYFAFSIRPKPEFQFTPTVLKIDERGSSTGIRNWCVRSSLDGFSRDIAVFTVPDNQFRFKQTIELGPAFQNLNGPVEFRIYGYNSMSDGGAWRLVNVELDGYVIPARPVIQIDSQGVLRWEGLKDHPYLIQASIIPSRWSIIGTNISAATQKEFRIEPNGSYRVFRIYCSEHRQHIDP
jgi:hypothetical protein